MGGFYRLYRILILAKNPYNFILIINILYILALRFPLEYSILSDPYYSHLITIYNYSTTSIIVEIRLIDRNRTYYLEVLLLFSLYLGVSNYNSIF